MGSFRLAPMMGAVPTYSPESLLVCRGQHGRLLHGLWHVRQIAAWHRAWEHDLIDQVQDHGGGLYTVPSKSRDQEWYTVQRYPMAPDGYLYLCSCPASESGGVVCAHAFAVYLHRLRARFGWRLVNPLPEKEVA